MIQLSHIHDSCSFMIHAMKTASRASSRRFMSFILRYLFFLSDLNSVVTLLNCRKWHMMGIVCSWCRFFWIHCICPVLGFHRHILTPRCVHLQESICREDRDPTDLPCLVKCPKPQSCSQLFVICVYVQWLEFSSSSRPSNVLKFLVREIIHSI